MVTPPQLLKKIWAVKRTAGVDTTTLYAALEANTRINGKKGTGKSSLKNLTATEAIALLNVLEGQKQKEERPTWVCSKKQEWLINTLEKQLLEANYFTTGSPLPFRENTIKRIAKGAYRNKLEHCQKAHAGAYIEALKGIIQREHME